MGISRHIEIQIYKLIADGFSVWEIGEIVELPEDIIKAYKTKYYISEGEIISKVIRDDKLFNELFTAFKKHCNTYSLNKKEVRVLIDRCESYKKQNEQ